VVKQLLKEPSVIGKDFPMEKLFYECLLYDHVRKTGLQVLWMPSTMCWNPILGDYRCSAAQILWTYVLKFDVTSYDWEYVVFCLEILLLFLLIKPQGVDYIS
jgi:hypothetical protein